MSTSKKILQGLELIQALSTTTTQVKWLDSAGSMLGHSSAERALYAVKSGLYYGKGNTSRVIYIREMTPPAQSPRHYRDDRAVLQPYSFGHRCLGSVKEQVASLDSWVYKACI